MTTSETTARERRDWTLLIFIIPIGIILMLIAGQIAIRLVPIWSVDAGMQSNLDPNNLPMQQAGPVQPVLSSILTPFGWLDTFLTPGSDGYDIISDFIVLDPSETATTAVPSTPTVGESPTVSVTQSSPTVVLSPQVTVTKKPTDVGTATPPPATTTMIPTATPPPATTTMIPTATTLPATTTVIPTATTAVPTATTPPPTATTAVPTATTPPPTPTPTGTLSTPPALYIPVTPPPPDIGVGVPPDGTPGQITPGTYTIINISGNPIYVSSTSDGNYDLILYEAIFPSGGSSIQMDQIIVGISNNIDGSYYEIFNWGDNIPDTNTNLDTTDLPPDPSCTGPMAPECDNRIIPTSELATPGSGILIDVDAAHGAPPEGTYNYLVILSPFTIPADNAQVDAIQVTEVPIPTPLPTP